MPLIGLMTDFGLKDGNVGAMKGVILGICPTATLVDISHDISPQNITEAALILWRAAPYFPAGTIFVIVIDPGVGTKRRPLAAQIGQQVFICPDNGILTLLIESAIKSGQTLSFRNLENEQYRLPLVSAVFHGRDIFAPAAAHLASGVPFMSLGGEITDPVTIEIPRGKKDANRWLGEVIHIDHFGNLTTSIRVEDLSGEDVLEVLVDDVPVGGLVRTFSDKEPGEMAALIGSTGALIVAEVNGSAARRLQARVGTLVEVLV